MLKKSPQGFQFLNMDIGVNAKGKGEYCVLTCAPLTQHNKMGEASDASRPGGDFSENFLTSRAVFKQDLSVYVLNTRLKVCASGRDKNISIVQAILGDKIEVP